MTEDVRDAVRLRTIKAIDRLRRYNEFYGDSFRSINGGIFKRDLEREEKMWLQIWKEIRHVRS